MDIALRGVEGSETERQMFRFKFSVLRIWGGCSLLFLTVNPHDIQTPLLLVFTNGDNEEIERISLDWDDATMAAYYDRVKQGNSLRLHELAARRPDAAARCVHWTFNKVLQVLFNCAPAANVKPTQIHIDTIPARCEPGLAGYLGSYLSIVEPQQRFTEHMHACVQVHGFKDPRSFFKVGISWSATDEPGVTSPAFLSSVKRASRLSATRTPLSMRFANRH